MAWRTVWPGALGATVAIGIVSYAFPAYLSNISTIARFGTTIVFILIVLGWFYVLALIILGGAIVNAVFAPGTYVAKKYTILNATGGVSGAFGSVTNTNLPAGFATNPSFTRYLLNSAASSSIRWGSRATTGSMQTSRNRMNCSSGMEQILSL